jgi:hypothetical protein
LLLLLLFRSFALLEEELTVVHHTTNWRLGVRADLYKIHTSFYSCIKRFLDRNDTNGFAVSAC